MTVGAVAMAYPGPRASAIRSPDDGIIVVSGLPRSGTSMMMRMLERGGLEVVTDTMRPPDDSNPLGYYEDQRVKRLRDGDHAWLEGASGKAVKVVTPLLEYLPARHGYSVLFMVRSIEEILASQRQMLLRTGQDAPQETGEALASRYREHLRRAESWLAAQPNVDTMYVHYGDVTEHPEGNAIRISRFLGRPLDHHAMTRAVDPGLYRVRYAHG